MSTTAPEAAPLSPAVHPLICAQIADALIYAGRDGRIELWNEAATALFGFSAAEALGQSLDLIIPPELREPHWKGFDRALETGHTRLGHQVLFTRALNRAGEAIYVEMSFAVITDPQSGALGAVAVARDASAHREQRRALRSCQAELEKRSGAAAAG